MFFLTPILDQNFTPTASAGNLGITFDKNVNFRQHISQLCCCCFYHIRGLHRIRRYLPLSVAKTIVTALISNRLDYCTSLYHNIALKDIMKLQRVQNCLSVVVSKSPRFSQSVLLLKSIHWLPIRHVKKSVKTDKRKFVEGLAQEAEKAAASRDMKQLYDTTRKLAGKFKTSERPIRDKNGSVLMGADKQLNRWAEHFEELLNRPAPQNQPDIQPAETDLPKDCNKPNRQEIKNGNCTYEKWESSMP